MIRRYTPLRARKLYRPPPRRDEDKVTPELANYILDRDRLCVAAQLDPHHHCRDRWGTYHSPDTRGKLQIAHVKDHARMGARAEPDRWHLVAECADANYNWSSPNRDRERMYILAREGPLPDG